MVVGLFLFCFCFFFWLGSGRFARVNHAGYTPKSIGEVDHDVMFRSKGFFFLFFQEFHQSTIFQQRNTSLCLVFFIFSISSMPKQASKRSRTVCIDLFFFVFFVGYFPLRSQWLHIRRTIIFLSLHRSINVCQWPLHIPHGPPNPALGPQRLPYNWWKTRSPRRNHEKKRKTWSPQTWRRWACSRSRWTGSQKLRPLRVELSAPKLGSCTACRDKWSSSRPSLLPWRTNCLSSPIGLWMLGLRMLSTEMPFLLCVCVCMGACRWVFYFSCFYYSYLNKRGFFFCITLCAILIPFWNVVFLPRMLGSFIVGSMYLIEDKIKTKHNLMEKTRTDRHRHVKISTQKKMCTTHIESLRSGSSWFMKASPLANLFAHLDELLRKGANLGLQVGKLGVQLIHRFWLFLEP